MSMYQCQHCKIWKSSESFYVEKGKIKTSNCKPCKKLKKVKPTSTHRRQYYLKNKEKILAQQRERYRKKKLLKKSS